MYADQEPLLNPIGAEARTGGIGLGLAPLAIAALIMALHTPQIHEANISSFVADVRPTVIEHVAEWRPQGPPPWGDVDQLTPDEVEEIPAVSPEFREMPAGGSGDPRDQAHR